METFLFSVWTAKLDGIRKRRKSESGPQAMEEYLQLPDDYENRTSEPGKKRVNSWAMSLILYYWYAC